MIDDKAVAAMIAAGGEPYSQIRGDIASGDLLFLHHDFVANWYGLQIEAVQRFTGPFAHIAVFDRVALGDENRVVVYESVVPKVRCVLVSATAEQGFFWMPMKEPMSKAERDAAWGEMGVNEYDKLGAIMAGMSDTLGPEEDALPRRWCAKAAALWRRRSGVDLGARYVPTDMAVMAMQRFNAPLRYVWMDEALTK